MKVCEICIRILGAVRELESVSVYKFGSCKNVQKFCEAEIGKLIYYDSMRAVFSMQMLEGYESAYWLYISFAAVAEV